MDGFQVSTRRSQPSFGRTAELPEKAVLTFVTAIPRSAGQLEGSESYMPEQGNSLIGPWFPGAGRQSGQRIWADPIGHVSPVQDLLPTQIPVYERWNLKAYQLGHTRWSMS